MAPTTAAESVGLAANWMGEMIDLHRCVEIIVALPQSERLPRALWLLDQMKTGPMGRRILSSLQTEYMLRCMWKGGQYEPC